MLHVGLDLSRKRLDVHVVDGLGEPLWVTAVSPDGESLDRLAERVLIRAPGEQVCAAIESMNGARFVHDRLEAAGWQVEVADAARVKGLAPLACKTDRIDARVLAELSRRDLVPAIWLPDPGVRQERELARWRLHVVKRRTALKERVHATLITFGHPCPVADLFGSGGRRLLDRLDLPEPWAGTTAAAVRLIDELDDEVALRERQLRELGADHRYVPRLITAPGIGWVLAFTIACEIGDITRFASPTKLVGYTGLCPRVYQSGETDHRGPLTKHGPRYLRWAYVEAAVHAANHPAFRARYQRTRRRLGKQRGPKVARVEVARDLARATWHMLTKDEDFAPEGATGRLAA
jgi:transposase